MRSIIAALCLSAAAAAVAHAQTPTPTIWAGPVVTPAAIRVEGNQAPVYEQLLSAAKTVNASGGAFVAGRENKTFQVTAGSTCSTFTLKLDGSVDCANFYTRTTVTNTDVSAGTTKLFDTTNADRCVRAYLSAASCTDGVTAYVGANP